MFPQTANNTASMPVAHINHDLLKDEILSNRYFHQYFNSFNKSNLHSTWDDNQFEHQHKIVSRKLQALDIKDSFPSKSNSLAYRFYPKKRFAFTPKSMIDAMQIVGLPVDIVEDDSHWTPYSGVIEHANQSQYFEFTEIKTEILSEFYTRGLEWLKLGVLNLPYEKVVFSIPIVIKGQKTSHLIMFASQNTDQTIRVKYCFYRFGEDRHFEMSSVVDFVRSEECDLGSSTLWKSTGSDEGTSKAHNTIFIACLMILATKGIETSRQKRKSYMPIFKTGEVQNYVTLINTKHFNMALGGNASGTVRPHFRRGHVRRLESGKLTWVRDSLINMHSQRLPDRKNYSVTCL